MIKILEFDAEMRAISGPRPNRELELDEPGQMLSMNYDPQSLSEKNLSALIDLIHLQLRQDVSTLSQDYPVLSNRFDAIKLKYLFKPTPDMDTLEKEGLRSLKNRYYDGLLDIL
jgi:hypothetical protein